MHMISNKDLNSAELETVTASRSPTTVFTANGEVQTHDIFLTVKVLEDTPAVLSLGKLCGEHGYSYEWINGQKTHHFKWFSNTVQYGKFRSSRGFWFIYNSFKLVYLNIHDTFKAGN